MFFNTARTFGTRVPLSSALAANFARHGGPYRPYATDHAKQCSNTSFNTQEKLSSLVRSWAGNNRPLENTLVLGIQHLLETTGDMLEVMKKDLGLKHAIVAGKSYSTHLPTVQRIKDMGFQVLESEREYPLCIQDFDLEMDNKALLIWQEAFKHIEGHKFDQFIIIDDGTHVIRTTPGKLFNGLKNKPDSVVGIEQTKGGAHGGANNYSKFITYPFPIIHVGGSYIKNTVEYRHVAKVALEHILEHAEKQSLSMDMKSQTVGVFGYGSLGKELVRTLSEKGFSVCVYDTDKYKLADLEAAQLPRVKLLEQPFALAFTSDIIIGATGQDVTALPGVMDALSTAPTTKLLYSTGSGAYEFETLLTKAQTQQKRVYYLTPQPLADVVYKNQSDTNVIIARGGCPMNFQNTAHSVAPEHIWPTRAAILSATLTAKQLASEKQTDEVRYPGIYTLPVNMQQDILADYAKQTKHSALIALLSQPQETISETIIKGSVGTCKIYTPDNASTLAGSKAPLNRGNFFSEAHTSECLPKEKAFEELNFAKPRLDH